MNDVNLLEQPFVPCNPLETSLLMANNGHLSVAEFLRVLLTSEVTVPSATEVSSEDGSMQPLFFKKGQGFMLAVFTHLERAKKFPEAKSFANMKGTALLRALPSEYGIVINPGFSVGLDISAEGIRDIVRDFGG